VNRIYVVCGNWVGRSVGARTIEGAEIVAVCRVVWYGTSTAGLLPGSCGWTMVFSAKKELGALVSY